jgi:group I intron endonuclease
VNKEINVFIDYHIFYILPHIYNKKMKSGIYKITNPKGEIYIGCSNDIELRKKQYQNLNLPNQKLIRESIMFYGWVNHKFEILEYTNDLINREKYYINLLNSFNKGLNGNKGGGGVSTHTEETKKLISEKSRINKGKRSNSHWKGKSKGKDFSKKLSLSLKGKPSHRKGKKLPKSHCDNISKSNKNIPKPSNNKSILQYDKEGNFIQEHISIEKAAQCVKGNPTAISNSLRKGGNSTSSSYIWRYKNE